MKLAYEQIQVEHSASVKIECYTYHTTCNAINWHVHPEYEIVYIKNGKGSLQIGSYFENYEDGVLVFLGPNVRHMPFSNKQFKNNLEVVIQFQESFIEDKLILFPEFEVISKFIRTAEKGMLFSPTTHKKLSSLFQKLKKQNKTERLINFIQILYQLSISENTKAISKDSISYNNHQHSLQRIAKVYQYINSNYNQDIGTTHMAEHLGLTPNSFCRMFKAMTNRTFIDFLNEFRIKKAQEYLMYTTSNISEAMYKCGFNDASYFARQFKKYTGKTPSQFNDQLHHRVND
ncbi:AraC family transcriptional regulator [Aquimarina algicola]|uniref:Helix-turn-helix domain-containing protein n=1 Tax=Aquimarina algicola TaxID=2589995 RepID=A0A504IZU0_9FLAO|nr:AraC family transcriptional regulator [Aquimarina algicola]TPN81662.1 helix-turn-helix domain-containing protein [Aquimarina algicola]